MEVGSSTGGSSYLTSCSSSSGGYCFSGDVISITSGTSIGMVSGLFSTFVIFPSFTFSIFSTSAFFASGLPSTSISSLFLTFPGVSCSPIGVPAEN
jgi:hypothetical protein